jgi:hypothetical protein
MTLTNWWKLQRPLPPFEITVKGSEHTTLRIGAVKIYPYAIWFLDTFNSEYFDGEKLEVIKVPYFQNNHGEKLL